MFPAVLMILVIGCCLPGCSSDADAFCTSLSANYKLQPLIDALTRRDYPAVTRDLTQMRKLEDTAPKELLGDVRAVLDVMEETIRALTPAEGSDGDRSPVDTAALNLRLQAIEKNAHNISSYADRNCGIKL